MNDNNTFAQGSLENKHGHLHQEIFEWLEDGLVFAMALDFKKARESFALVQRFLTRHRVDEELALKSLPKDLDLPRGVSEKIIVTEHDRLDKLCIAADETLRALQELQELGRVSEYGQRLALVRHLEPLTRLRHLLEHHTDRENELLYPFFELHLGDEEKAALELHVETLVSELESPEEHLRLPKGAKGQVP